MIQNRTENIKNGKSLDSSKKQKYKFNNLLKWTKKDVLVAYQAGNPMSRIGGNQKHSNHQKRLSRQDYRRKKHVTLEDNTPPLFQRNKVISSQAKRVKKKRFKDLRKEEKLLSSFEKVLGGSTKKKEKKRNKPNNKEVKKRMKQAREKKMVSHLYDNKRFGISKTRNFLCERNKIGPSEKYPKPKTRHQIQTWTMEMIKNRSYDFQYCRPKFGKRTFSRIDRELKKEMKRERK